MSPLEFIQENVEKSLAKEGFSSYISQSCSREAVRYFERKDSFAKGKVFDECLKRARSQAKLMNKAGC